MVESAPHRPAGDCVAGRRFRGARKVRLGDVTATGRLRLDALTRYTQDVSDDDTNDAGMSSEPTWVVRRTAVDILRPATLGEEIVITTYCSGLGRRWAERHLVAVGDAGASYEASTLWICVDSVNGRPRSLTQEFLAIYGSAAAGRKVSARLAHPKPSSETQSRPWPLRAVDFDTLRHVNNAAYWAVVEEVLDGDEPPYPFRASIEYGKGLSKGAQVLIAEAEVDGARCLWWLVDDGVVVASASIQPMAPEP